MSTEKSQYGQGYEEGQKSASKKVDTGSAMSQVITLGLSKSNPTSGKSKDFKEGYKDGKADAKK